jgi:hypothetical protein
MLSASEPNFVKLIKSRLYVQAVPSRMIDVVVVLSEMRHGLVFAKPSSRHHTISAEDRQDFFGFETNKKRVVQSSLAAFRLVCL